MKQHCKSLATLLVSVTTLGLITATAHASVIASEGFEVQETGANAYGWNDTSITRTANGSGSLGLTAPSGGYYAEIHNTHDTYSSGYGGAGYTYFGGRTTYPGSAFSQSVDVYLDPSWSQVPSGAAGKFSIDFAASKPDLSGSDYGTESRFSVRLGTNPGTLKIGARGNGSYTTVSTAGWYTFETIFAKGAVGSDPSTSTMNLYNTGSGDLIASQIFSNYSASHPNNSNYTTLSQDLGGTGFLQFFVWRNEFADDTLGIDNIQTRTIMTAVPEPSALAMIGLGLLLLTGGLSWQKKHGKRPLN